MSELSAAPSGAASSSVNAAQKCPTNAKQSRGQKCWTNPAKNLLVLLDSTTALGLSKQGLPPPIAAPARATAKPTADSNWFRARVENL